MRAGFQKVQLLHSDPLLPPSWVAIRTETVPIPQGQSLPQSHFTCVEVGELSHYVFTLYVRQGEE